MANTTVDLPQEVLTLLAQSRLRDRTVDEEVRVAVAIHLFLEGLVSIGKAAELAGEPRLAFERQLVELGLPTVRYELSDYTADLEGIAEAERRSRVQ